MSQRTYPLELDGQRRLRIKFGDDTLQIWLDGQHLNALRQFGPPFEHVLPDGRRLTIDNQLPVSICVDGVPVPFSPGHPTQHFWYAGTGAMFCSYTIALAWPFFLLIDRWFSPSIELDRSDFWIAALFYSTAATLFGAGMLLKRCREIGFVVWFLAIVVFLGMGMYLSPDNSVVWVVLLIICGYDIYKSWRRATASLVIPAKT